MDKKDLKLHCIEEIIRMGIVNNAKFTAEKIVSEAKKIYTWVTEE